MMRVEMSAKVPAADAGYGRIPPRYKDETGVRTVPIALSAFTIIGSGVVLFCFNPSQYSFYPLCLFHSYTGLLCPGCGSLRALHQLLHGHVIAAIRLNVLLISALPVAILFFVRFAHRKLNNQPAAPGIRPAWLWWGLTVIIIFGVLRNLPFAQSAWLAP
jgi:quinol-cytochrome oxidoreductase complex cytochrome b subunit